MKVAGKIAPLALPLLLLFATEHATAQHKPKDAACLACHADRSLTTERNGRTITLFVDATKAKHSIHRSLGCVDCHKDVKASPHEKTPAAVSCAQCHAAAQAAWQHSFHATAKKPDGRTPAGCLDCHGGNAHAILAGTNPQSPVAHTNIPATCGACHGQKFLMESNGSTAQPFVSYESSVHGRAIGMGLEKAAVCTDCHGSHEILAANDDHSLINKFNIPNTCGKCHAGVQSEFAQSIHGQAIARGNSLAPVCTDCHGIHTIKATAPGSGSDQALARDTCAGCHQGVRLTQEFGVSANRVSTYLDSYHGLASKGGSAIVANCASCHGAHNILPSTNPHSTIHPANLAVTCGQCHKGVTARFVLNKVHIDSAGGQSNDSGTLAVRWVRRIYVPIIVVIIGGMFLHNLLIWRAKVMARRHSVVARVVRMTRNQRWQHGILLVSFLVLVVTGFALKFPDSWVASLLGMSEHWRSIIHRVAGVALVADGVYHAFYLVLTAEGRKLFRDLLPVPKDIADACGTLLYYAGFRPAKPQFSRFNYAEKAEYWALVWGTALMAVTGTMLWAKVSVGNLLARWWLDAATAVHFYEAILATLAILVWHFYQVFFDPDVYPMNTAWRDGTMPLDHYRHEHPLDTETLSHPIPGAGESPASAD